MKRRFSKQPIEHLNLDASVKMTKQQIVRQKLGSVQDTIIHQLEHCELIIPRSKVPYLSQKQKQTVEELAHERILNEKRKMQQRIKQLENTEKMYLGKSRLIEKTKDPPSPYKVQMTEEDKQNLKKLKKKLKQFQKSVQKKTADIEQENIRLKKQEEARLERERMAANEIKKAKIEQRLEQMKQRNLQREAEKKKEDNALKKIEQKKKLYQILDISWKQKNNLEEQRKYELMEMKIKQKRVNFAQLREHEKKYEEIISQKKKELMQKRLSSSRQSPTNSSFSAQKSKFFTVIAKQQRKARQIEEMKKERPKLIHQKRLEYAEFVREQFVPKPKPATDDEAPKQKEEPKLIKMTKQQIKEMGNSNLRLGNKRAKKKQNLDASQPIKLEGDTMESKSATGHYHDYLKQVRLKKEEKDYYKGFYNSPKFEAEKIMKDEKIKKEDKIAKIKLLANRFDNQSTDIVTKIQGKIQILEVIN